MQDGSTFALSAQDSMTDPEHPYALPYFHEALREAGIARDPASGVLYHYTSADGLCGIVSTGAVWATHSSFFNDTSEYEYGQSLLPAALHRLTAAGLEHFQKLLEPMFQKSHGYDVYAACFSEYDDLLPQWRGYGAEGSGYAIGFPSAALSRDGAAALLPVMYGDEAVVRRFESMVDWAIDRLRALREAGTFSQEAVGGILTSLACSLFLLIVASKKAVFEYEHEWRLVHLVDRDQVIDYDKIGVRTIGGMIVPYLSLALPRTSDSALCISTVRCGPALKDDSVRAGVGMLLTKHRLAGTPVLKSEAPVRR